jgi:hypothetical protein
MQSAQWYAEFPEETPIFLVAGAAGEQLCENPCDKSPQRLDRQFFSETGYAGSFESHIPAAREIIEQYPTAFQSIRKRVKNSLIIYGLEHPFDGCNGETRLIDAPELRGLIVHK